MYNREGTACTALAVPALIDAWVICGCSVQALFSLCFPSLYSSRLCVFVGHEKGLSHSRTVQPFHCKGSMCSSVFDQAQSNAGVVKAIEHLNTVYLVSLATVHISS